MDPHKHAFLSRSGEHLQDITCSDAGHTYYLGSTRAGKPMPPQMMDALDRARAQIQNLSKKAGGASEAAQGNRS